MIDALNEDIYNLARDRHLNIAFAPNSPIFEETEEIKQEYRAFLLSQNYGFEEVKVLSGGIGYLKLNFFAETGGFPKAVHKAEETMSSFKRSKAIIFDLRDNSGGSPEMIQLLSSYLFEGEPIHLNSFYWRKTDSETETWTLLDVEG